MGSYIGGIQKMDLCKVLKKKVDSFKAVVTVPAVPM